MTTGSVVNRELLLARGGLLHWALQRVGFETSSPAAAARAAVVFSLVTWLPLLLLSLVEASRVGAVSIPFLKDFSTGGRFLVALPLLLFADSFIEPRLAAVARHFTAADLVPVEERPRFLRAIERALWLQAALLPQLVILALALGLALLVLSSTISPEVSSWHTVVTVSGSHRTWAGAAYDFVSLPLYRVVLFTWLWRYLVWTWFLWRTSRLHLRITPSHPDHSGGLGFIGVGQMAMAILMLALSVVTAGIVGTRVAYLGASLASFYSLITGYLVLVLILFLGPLFMFSPALFRAKERGMYRYSILGEEYVGAFERKWIDGQDEARERPLGNPDFQSLADLAASFAVVQQMRPYPFNLRIVAIMVVAAVAPLLPLVLLERSALGLLRLILQLVI